MFKKKPKQPAKADPFTVWLQGFPRRDEFTAEGLRTIYTASVQYGLDAADGSMQYIHKTTDSGEHYIAVIPGYRAYLKAADALLAPRRFEFDAPLLNGHLHQGTTRIFLKGEAEPFVFHTLISELRPPKEKKAECKPWDEQPFAMFRKASFVQAIRWAIPSISFPWELAAIPVAAPLEKLDPLSTKADWIRESIAADGVAATLEIVKERGYGQEGTDYVQAIFNASMAEGLEI